MARKRTQEPKTQMEAVTKIWMLYQWLCKRNPIWIALGFWMAFGGGIFLWKNYVADTVKVEEIQPVGAVISPQFSIMPTAFAGENGPPIVFAGKTYGFQEDTTLVVKAVLGQPFLLVFDKSTGKVSKMAFDRSVKSMSK